MEEKSEEEYEREEEREKDREGDDLLFSFSLAPSLICLSLLLFLVSGSFSLFCGVQLWSVIGFISKYFSVT